jgi:hypothetical protein
MRWASASGISSPSSAAARSLRAAALEGDDMPEALAHRMEQALAQAAQTQTTRRIWRRRLIGLRDRMLRR